MLREESPADVLDGYAFDFGLDYYDDDDWGPYDLCGCEDCSPWVDKLCAEDAPVPPSRFANHPRIRCRGRR